MAGVFVDTTKILKFPVRNPDLFSPEINCQILTSSEFSRILDAAIRALPYVQDPSIREDLKRALCDLLRIEEVA
ncbi:MAG TPA: hypothetical protein VHV29_13140 [Terriglobales bacterium]|jgi:hypothetical protein|nr:hypothetical protein [Terriglobales bacterium]